MSFLSTWEQLVKQQVTLSLKATKNSVFLYQPKLLLKSITRCKMNRLTQTPMARMQKNQDRTYLAKTWSRWRETLSSMTLDWDAISLLGCRRKRWKATRILKSWPACRAWLSWSLRNWSRVLKRHPQSLNTTSRLSKSYIWTICSFSIRCISWRKVFGLSQLKACSFLLTISLSRLRNCWIIL